MGRTAAGDLRSFAYVLLSFLEGALQHEHIGFCILFILSFVRNIVSKASRGFFFLAKTEDCFDGENRTSLGHGLTNRRKCAFIERHRSSSKNRHDNPKT